MLMAAQHCFVFQFDWQTRNGASRCACILFSVLCNAAEFILLAALERKESNFRLLCSNFWLHSMGHGLQYDV
jgi:hypothetical protein